MARPTLPFRPDAPVLRTLYGTLPRGVRSTLRSAHRASILRLGLAQLGRDPLAAADDGRTLGRLVVGWDNAGWSAHVDYLARIVRRAAAVRGGTILECGSGLTTLVLAAVAARNGSRVVALEHTPAWRARVERALVQAGTASAVDVVDAPLVDYGPFDWYRVDDAVRARRYDLVVCDGPPGETRGGRRGVLPVMRGSLADGCVVLLDDAQREAEREVLGWWHTEFGGDVWLSPHSPDGKGHAEYLPPQGGAPVR